METSLTPKSPRDRLTKPPLSQEIVNILNDPSHPKHYLALIIQEKYNSNEMFPFTHEDTFRFTGKPLININFHST
jgi:hypothetical protein